MTLLRQIRQTNSPSNAPNTTNLSGSSAKPCSTCGCPGFWRGARGPIRCMVCEPPVSQALVKQRLLHVLDDDGIDMLVDWDEDKRKRRELEMGVVDSSGVWMTRTETIDGIDNDVTTKVGDPAVGWHEPIPHDVKMTEKTQEER